MMSKTKRLAKKHHQNFDLYYLSKEEGYDIQKCVIYPGKFRHLLSLLDDDADYTSFLENLNDCILLDEIDHEFQSYDDLSNELSKDL